MNAKKTVTDFFSHKQNKELAVFLVLGLAIIIFDFSYVLKKQWSGHTVLAPQVKEARQRIKDSLGAEFRVENLQKRAEELSIDVSSKRAGIVAEEQIPDVLGEISKMSDKVSLKIMKMTPQREVSNRAKFTTAEGVEFYRLPISLAVRAGFHPLGKFLNELESSDYFFRVDSLDIFPPRARDPEHDINIGISIFVVRKSID